MPRKFSQGYKPYPRKGTKKKVAAVITEVKAASSLSTIRNVKKMEGSENYYRIRIGDYRIGFRAQDKVLVFLRCLHRKDIYRYFP
ncbi:MAG: type II toxin-antitoxin system RelE/ParE family toxin [Anaerolineales bacterium]|nr:type II toxin-antitoxin system RelE/ParE family toxin [Anaerolineales bacterium]